MNKITFILNSICILLLTGCGKGYDNFDEPESSLTGTVLYDGQAIGVCTDGQTLELWQDGFGKSSAIYVQIAQDGTYSACLFNGTYKLVVKSGSTAPWEDLSSDTTEVVVKGKTTHDIEVTPYLTISNANITTNSTSVTFTFTVNQIVSEASISNVRLYLNANKITDNKVNDQYVEISGDDITLGSSFSYTVDISDDLLEEDYIFARIGVVSNKSTEYYYTQVEQIDL